MQSIIGKVKRWISGFKPSPQIVVLQEPEQSEYLLESVLDDRVFDHGSVWVENNQVTVQDPGGLGDFPSIEIPNDDRVTVAIDGKQVRGRQVIHQAQTITVNFNNKPPLRRITVKASKDAMEVVVKIDYEPGEDYRLYDRIASRHAVLEVEAVVTAPVPYEVADILREVHARGFVGDIDKDALEVVSHSLVTAERVILRGRAPRPGRPDRYVKVAIPTGSNHLQHRRRGVTVATGTTVAVLEPGLPGSSGRDVYGNLVEPPAMGRLQELGPGVTQIGGRVVALRNGRLVFTQSRIDVLPELVIHHNLTAKDGRIEFDGDVIVHGSVLDGSFIRATGSVTVFGSILCSTVIAGHGVFVSNAIVGSEVVADQSKFLYKNLLAVLKRCIVEFSKFQREYDILVARAETLGDNRVYLLADVLLTRRHSALMSLLQDISTDTDNLSKVDSQFMRIKQELRSRWTELTRKTLFPHDITKLHGLLIAYANRLETISTAKPAKIRAASVTSSSLRSTGNILIHGLGVFASTLESEEALVINGQVRGGFLVAGRTVRVNELGTPSGTETSVRVNSSSGRITVNIRHPNTLLRIGAQRDLCTETEYRVVYDGEGRRGYDTYRACR